MILNALSGLELVLLQVWLAIYVASAADCLTAEYTRVMIKHNQADVTNNK